MLKWLFSVFVCFRLVNTYAQQTIIEGSVVDAITYYPIESVEITIDGSPIRTSSDAAGKFLLSKDLPLGPQVLVISKSGYVPKRYPIIINEGEAVSIFDMTLVKDASHTDDLFLITLADDELHSDTSGADNIAGLLASSLDVFQRTAAFEFSSSFFRSRGLDSNNGKILINGIEMNKAFNGRPQWSNWGGINDVLRNQELVVGLAPSSYNFGGVLGSTNINTRASLARQGGRITYSSSNRSYSNRLMATYASGLLKSNWAYTISFGARWGNEGFQEGTVYNSNSIFASVEKKVNENHSLSFTGIYTPNRRGKSSPNTQEVYNIKGTKYNAYWGWQDGQKRNSRVKEVNEPILMLNHFWDINKNITINSNIAYQFGFLGNSRLDYTGTDLINGIPQGGGANPSPTYYQKLPSYFEREFPDNPGLAYLALKAFQKEGQIDWDTMYEANINNSEQGGNAIYALYQDKVKDSQFTVNSILNASLNSHVLFNASLGYKRLKSKNFAEVTDLLGARTYLDIDPFASSLDAAQNDLQNPNRIVTEGDVFKYNYNMYASQIDAFIQGQFTYSQFDFYASASINRTQYQREGLFQNGGFPDNSLGRGTQLVFNGFGLKGGSTYKLSSKHIFELNLGIMSRAPFIQNVYSNSRENHNVVPNISEENINSIDVNYVFRSSIIKAKMTGYYTNIINANQVSYYFADGVGGDNAIFVQEILQGLNKKYFGAELGVEAQVTSTIKLKGVAALGQFTYDNDPSLFLTTEPNKESEQAGFIDGFKDFGQSKLKNYRLGNGPQNAYSIGFEYRDPDFWWFGTSANFFSNTFLSINPLTRSSNFNTDFDGNPFPDYDEQVARDLLRQEKFKDYMVVNLVGGKSWKVGDYYLGVFASINNLLDEVYRTGGFEQRRNANYRQLRDDMALETPVFGPNYWYGRGTTYFINLNLSF
ncbi:carboxypeptidase regulatory-like domain-containing protein [Cognatitamlana onchidii]|uniref:carboxypeptidase regulatory-like domain-containing protein n=1 Tax=Cognatitamlana onchidii TaxID=2562860 RepID=UPI0010A67357|nr:carboxypeptidase regulatory-like domain-containing protein [Algibacter onchidii]